MRLVFRNPVVKIIKALSRKERNLFFASLLVFCVSGLVYGVLFIKTNTHVIAANGGTYREGVVGQPAFMNPIIPTTETDRLMSRLVFASIKNMAESIKSSQDGKTWNVRLKEGISWHDGEKVTADDVVFTVDVIHNPESRSPLRGSFEGVSVTRVSELEVEFKLENTYAFFEEDHLASLLPIPKHLFFDLPITNYKLSPFGLVPVGSGPYMVDSHEKDAKGFIKSFRLKANKEYFGEVPHITTFVFKFYRKEQELISAYNLGQIDGFGLSTNEPLVEKSIIIRHQPHYLTSSRYYAIFINQSLAGEKLTSASVRRALSGAINRDELIDRVFDGQGTPFFGPTALDTDPATSFDLSLLEGLELNIVVPDEPFLVETAEEVEKAWEVAGANVNLIIRSLRDIQEDVLKNTNYELLLFGNIIKESNDLFAFWHSSKRFFPDQNLALYQDEVVDKMLEDYRTNFDTSTRHNILERISGRISAEIPAIFLYSPNYTYISTPTLGGFDDLRKINTSDDRFADITDWFVKARRTFRAPIGEVEK